ncbi:MAG: leucine--tRNA ligase [Candidatus Harrisonbacteria bacterium CG10_big_fil_rev_8_21_14_0_10_42_17]|uniref:Leucine--tRNA ligase n=1 Tax=Candidatus Harrisonbacteria bacterium CG10_big_fil_rev_8_21_14_0_10_42_17 TaxID=1974584 RepID=A0A2M6WJ70_9BACT|nr:MAG: leucine--tRNA ligase [Candidatus Harrisonbacteria bacterium CG10_big_fil_rev_8_21_14_0_10_42_17]
MNGYNPKEIEQRWQKRWIEEKTYKAEEKSSKEKYYQLETFPYPSAAGLHVGHPKGYIAEDIHARFMRMKGKEVLYTMGWDAFGLPTENYAIKIGKSPKEVAEENIKNFKRQVQMFGLSYDWDREINSSSPEYYKWTQWLFIQLFKKGLAYRKKANVNWCPSCKTVLANEQVVDGACERCKTIVEQKEMEQWFLKITDYAERLINDLNSPVGELDWPEPTIKRQLDWIGKSVGVSITFPLASIPGQDDGKHSVEIFTTRPDTLFGATFIVISPELAEKWINVGWQAPEEVRNYIKESLKGTERERLENADDKTGVDTGIKAVNPGTKEKIPVWVADYVLGSYGTGAIMAVPAHDDRDLQFAKKFKLPIKKVIEPETPQTVARNAEDIAMEVGSEIKVVSECYGGEGTLVNSGDFNGKTSESARKLITDKVDGKEKTQYKLRDWSVSRQRYWGTPVPVIHCEKCALQDPSGQGIVPVPEDQLPVLLPELEDYRPKGVPPLASSEEFINIPCPKCGGQARRDPETLDTFVDSSWYFLRYTDPHNEEQPFEKLKVNHWMPVDLYVIGAEHTVLHLLYARFITKFLHDEGYLNTIEPFLKLRHVGLIQGSDGQKMSKSRGNVVNPDEVVGEFGVDAFRLYEMFMGPFEHGQPWDPQGILGTERFLKKIWTYVEIWKKNYEADGGKGYDEQNTNGEIEKLLNKTIKKVEEDIKSFSFNTAISALMIFTNKIREELSTGFKKNTPLTILQLEKFIKILHPFAPHITQELWEQLGNDTTLTFEPWSQYDEKLLKEETITIAIQINGKTRDTVHVQRGSSKEDVEKVVLENTIVQKWIKDSEIEKFIFVPDRLVNICLKE